jgi:hypothetical protein
MGKMSFRKSFLIFCGCILSLALSAQDSSRFEIKSEGFNERVLEFVQDHPEELFVVVLQKGCNGIYYFDVQAHSSYPELISKAVKENTHFLDVDGTLIPIISDMDYALQYNRYRNELRKNSSEDIISFDVYNSKAEESVVIPVESSAGRFGRIIPESELIER